MARQEGIIKIKGTIGDIAFYKSKDGHMARFKGGIDASRIKSDPAFARTRENGEEFGASAKAGKVLRDAIRPLLMTASDSRVISRLMKVMSSIKNLDSTSVRGKRNVGTAIALPIAKLLLKGFNFNLDAVLGCMLFIPYIVNTATGEITISNLVPINNLVFPEGATHVVLKGAWAKVDFVTNAYEVEYSNAMNLPIDGTLSAVSLLPAAVPTGVGTDLFILHVEFFQQVNMIQYSLKNGAFNAMCIVEVS